MDLFVQLNLAEIPKPEQDRLGNKGLIQFFYCTNTEPHCELDAEGWAPFSTSHCVRWIENPTPDFNETATGPQSELGGGQIIGWEAADDYPGLEDLSTKQNVDIELSEDEEEEYYELSFPVDGEKLGGWPYWIQGPEYPACPECAAKMEFVFQVDSDTNLDFMFGDSGAGHITRCPHHHHQLAFGWACY